MLPPTQERPIELQLRAELQLELAAGEMRQLRNVWPLWAVPRPRLPARLPLLGALRQDQAFRRLDRQVEVVDAGQASPSAPFVAEELTREVLDLAQAGGAGLVWLRRPDARFAQPVAFWREAIHVFAPHTLWERVPQPGYADLRFYGVATDFALDLRALQVLLGSQARCRPVWRRFDARQLTWAEYLVEVQVEAGLLLVSTLRFEGGLGRQPATFDANPMGSWLLASLLEELAVERRT
jgi:hypothetical protein